MNRRRQLVKLSKQHGLLVQPAALQTMMQHEDEEQLLLVLGYLRERLAKTNPKIVSKDLWEQASNEIQPKGTGPSGGAVVPQRSAKRSVDRQVTSGREGKASHRDWQILDAFDHPKLIYDPLRQQFRYEDIQKTRPSLFGTVDDKTNMMTQRFLRVQQSVERSVKHLTSIDRLLGTSVSSAQVLLGLLHSASSSLSSDGVMSGHGFELEDLTGTIPLQLQSNSHVDSRGVYTEGCLVLVQGFYDNGIFIVDKLSLPPVETKAGSSQYSPPPPSRASARVATASPLSIYTMANVAMDDPLIVQQLDELVETINGDSSGSKSVLVLMGNFTAGTMPYAVVCEELARTLEPLSTECTVLLMPGPNDTPSLCWPIPPMKSHHSLANQLDAEVHFVSNPCRLDYAGEQEIVFFRQDVIRQHLQHQILAVRSSEHPTESRVINTLLSQGHLLPQAPIYWNFDHSLNLYPVPELLVLGLEEGDDNISTLHESDCQVVVPGSNGNWAKVTLNQRGRGTKRPYRIGFSQEENPSDAEEDSLDAMEEF